MRRAAYGSEALDEVLEGLVVLLLLNIVALLHELLRDELDLLLFELLPHLVVFVLNFVDEALQVIENDGGRELHKTLLLAFHLLLPRSATDLRMQGYVLVASY